MRGKLNKLYTAISEIVEGDHDVPESFYDGWTIEERRRFVLNFHKWNGDPEEYDENFLVLSGPSIIHYLDDTQEHIGVTDMDLLEKFLKTMFYSWGSDTPSEVFWAGNEFLEWLEKQFGIKLENRFNEGVLLNENEEDEFGAVLEEIKSKLS